MIYRPSYSIPRLAANRLVDTEEEEVYPTIIVESLTSTLNRLLRWFTYHSDPILASECYILLEKISNSFLLKEQSESKIVDVALRFLLVSSKFDDMVTLFYKHCEGKEMLSSDDGENDVIRHCLGLISCMTDDEPFSLTIACYLEESLRQACECTEVEMEADMETEDEGLICMDIIKKRLAVTTILMLYSKLCIDTGRTNSAVKFLNWCRTTCRELMRCLHSMRSHSSSDGLTLDDIAVQIDDIITSCYERLAVAFCLLGIRRKAEDNALLAALKQNVVLIENFNRISIIELSDTIEQYGGREPFLYPLRSLMKIKSLSTSADKMSALVVSVNNDVGCKSNLVDVLSSSKNVLACKFLCAVAFSHLFERFISHAVTLVASQMMIRLVV